MEPTQPSRNNKKIIIIGVIVVILLIASFILMRVLKKDDEISLEDALKSLSAPPNAEMNLSPEQEKALESMSAPNEKPETELQKREMEEALRTLQAN